MPKIYTDGRTATQIELAYRDEAGMFTNDQAVTEMTKDMLRTGHRIFEVHDQSGFC